MRTEKKISSVAVELGETGKWSKFWLASLCAMTHSWWRPPSSSSPLYLLSGGTSAPSPLDRACNWPLKVPTNILQLSPNDNHSYRTWQHSISVQFERRWVRSRVRRRPYWISAYIIRCVLRALKCLFLLFPLRSENETQIGRGCLVTRKCSTITSSSDVQWAMRPCLCHMLCLITWKLSFPEAMAV